MEKPRVDTTFDVRTPVQVEADAKRADLVRTLRAKAKKHADRIQAERAIRQTQLKEEREERLVMLEARKVFNKRKRRRAGGDAMREYLIRLGTDPDALK